MQNHKVEHFSFFLVGMWQNIDLFEKIKRQIWRPRLKEQPTSNKTEHNSSHFLQPKKLAYDFFKTLKYWALGIPFSVSNYFWVTAYIRWDGVLGLLHLFILLIISTEDHIVFASRSDSSVN